MQTKLIDATRWLRFFPALILSLILFGCAPIIYFTGINNTDLRDKDLDALRGGDLLEVRDRYEPREKSTNDKERLNFSEQAVLCDIYIKHVSIGKAYECLDKLEGYKSDDPKVKERTAGKRALLALIQGDFQRASELTKEGKNYGNKYVHAIAEAKMDKPKVALDTANEWAYSYEPIKVYLAGNLYLVAGQYEKALQTLNDLERRLSRDYSLSGTKDIFGNKIDPAPLKFDLFGEFGFGLLDTYSYAPQGNAYVEYVLAKCYKELGQKAEAIKRFDKILSFPKIAAYRDVYWLALYERGLLAEADGKQQDAIKFYKDSIDTIESARASITTDAGKIGFVGDKQKVYARLIDLLTADSKVSEAFEYSERSRSRSLVDLLASVRFGRHKGQPIGVDQLVINYEKQEAKVLESQAKSRTAIERGLGDRLDKKRELLDKDRLIASQVSVDDTTKTLDIKRNLKNDEALLSYFLTEKGWKLFLVTKNQDAVSFDLEDADLDDNISKFHSSLENIEKNKAFGEKIHNILLKPKKVNLDGINLLTIVPFGKLHYFPFSALYTKGKYLLENFTIRTLPSASVLEYFTPYSKPKETILVFGNTSLEGAEKEASKIADKFIGSKLLLNNNETTKANLMNLAPSFSRLHFATHGTFDPKNPLLSYIEITKSGGNDGKLQVSDLFHLEQPWDAQLAVLSTCDSNLSIVTNGDEMIGFERAFLYAGAESFLGTLWKIVDDKTEILMDKFYDDLKLRKKPVASLRKAQLYAIEQGWSPKHWAAFMFSGAE